jgi:hypothetical protein
MRSRVQAVLFCVLASCALALSFAPRASYAKPADDQARATFLLLLSKYVTWPDGAFSSPASPVVVAVVGNPSLVAQLKALARGLVVGGRAFEIRDAAGPADCAGAHIVFVASSDDARALASAPPLRVSERPDRIADTDIAIRMQEGRVAFVVNRGDVQRRGLKLSSKLMRLASTLE